MGPPRATADPKLKASDLPAEPTGNNRQRIGQGTHLRATVRRVVQKLRELDVDERELVLLVPPVAAVVAQHTIAYPELR